VSDFDIAILGGGPGGYVAALHAGAKGAKVALVERDRVGGTCVTVGCIPSKALLDSSHFYWMGTHTAVSGLHLAGEFDLPKAMARKEHVVRQLVSGIEQLLKARKVELIKAEGALVGPNEIGIRGGEAKRITANATIVATGSSVALPPIKGLAEAKPLDNVSGLALQETPKRLVVIGGGVVGMELGAFYSEVGSDVTVLEMLPQPLSGSDPDLVKLLVRALESHGNFRVVANAKVTGVERRGKTVTVTAELDGKSKAFEGDEVLLGAGRIPYLGGVDSTSFAMGGRGIQVDDRMRSSVEGVWAIGDCTAASFENGAMLAHVASTQGEIAVDTILGEDARMDYDVVPSVVYTHPEIASVGLSEAKAKERFGEGNVKASRFPFRASGRALALGESDGMVKLITTGSDHRIVGVHVMGPQASELIAEATLAIRLEATAEDIAATVHAHPTLAETLREAALVALGRPIHTAR
jgi:dihydrolipoamide dehydrogenase